MSNYTYKDIPINKLLLDINNPRHDILKNQDEAIREMIIDQGDKLLNLARDIVGRGINPSELNIVANAQTGIDEYIVLEGNRRTAAIQLLLKPILASLGGKPHIIKFFKEKSVKFNEKPIIKLKCVVFENREDAMHQILLRHTGENNGVGIVNWDSEAVARFKQRLGKPSTALQIIEFVKKNAKFHEDEKQEIENIPLTNIARLINDPDVRTALGIRIEEGDIVTDLPLDEVIKALTKIVTDIAGKKITVNDIRHKLDRKVYLESFETDELPSNNFMPTETYTLRSISGSSLPSSSTDKSIKIKKSVPLSTSRKTLIPTRCVLKIDHHRLNKIYRELRGLEVDDYPNACGVMLRVFLELSLEEYAKLKGISFTMEPNFSMKLQTVADYMKKNGVMSNSELKPVRVAISNRDVLFSTNTLHAYVHNKDFAPRSKDLKQTWDNMQIFFEKMWP